MFAPRASFSVNAPLIISPSHYLRLEIGNLGSTPNYVISTVVFHKVLFLDPFRLSSVLFHSSHHSSKHPELTMTFVYMAIALNYSSLSSQAASPTS